MRAGLDSRKGHSEVRVIKTAGAYAALMAVTAALNVIAAASASAGTAALSAAARLATAR
jgi:hypothetical protein